MDIYFSAKPLEGKKNWVQIDPEKGWYPMIRFYGPLKAYTDKTWKPDDLVLLN